MGDQLDDQPDGSNALWLSVADNIAEHTMVTFYRAVGGTEAARAPSEELRLGPYWIVEILGRGAFGSVFLAVKQGATKRLCAIKISRTHTATDSTEAREFRATSALLSGIRHDNVVSLFEAAWDDGKCHSIMEYVEGASLAALMLHASTTRSRIPIAIAARIVRDVLLGLQAVHSSLGADGNPLHIVHGDICPQNILVSSEGISKVADLGAAQFGERHFSPDQALGHVRYMAPERTRDARATVQADIFSVGVIFWELLVGETMHKTLSDESTLRKLKRLDYQRPSQLNRDVPSEFDDLCKKALDPTPMARYRSCLEFLNDLNRLNATVSDSVVGSQEDVESFVKSAFAGDIVARSERVRKWLDHRPHLRPYIPASNRAPHQQRPRESESNLVSSGSRLFWHLTWGLWISTFVFAFGTTFIASRHRTAVNTTGSGGASPVSGASAQTSAHAVQKAEVPPRRNAGSSPEDKLAHLFRDLRPERNNPRSVRETEEEIERVRESLRETRFADRLNIVHRLAELYAELESAGWRVGDRKEALAASAEAIERYEYAAATASRLKAANLQEILYSLAMEYERREDYDEARRVYFYIVSRTPVTEYTQLAYLSFGDLFLREASQGVKPSTQDAPSSWALARASYVQALKYPSLSIGAYAHYKLAFVFWQNGEHSEAIASLCRAINATVQAPNAHLAAVLRETATSTLATMSAEEPVSTAIANLHTIDGTVKESRQAFLDAINRLMATYSDLGRPDDGNRLRVALDDYLLHTQAPH